jgi:hypothetical protein
MTDHDTTHYKELFIDMTETDVWSYDHIFASSSTWQIIKCVHYHMRL